MPGECVAVTSLGDSDEGLVLPPCFRKELRHLMKLWVKLLTKLLGRVLASEVDRCMKFGQYPY